MDTDEIDKHFTRGQKAWADGLPMPDTSPDGTKILTPTTLYWLGYMFERGRDFFRRRDMALYPDSVEPRP